MPSDGGRCADSVAFEATNGEAQLLNQKSLASLFTAGGGAVGVELVFVSACHSQNVGLSFAAAGVPHVVAVQEAYTIRDQASIAFSHEFYIALLVREWESLRAPGDSYTPCPRAPPPPPPTPSPARQSERRLRSARWPFAIMPRSLEPARTASSCYWAVGTTTLPCSTPESRLGGQWWT